MELIDKSKRAKPVIVYLSAQEHVHVALKALNLGAVNYLEKSDKVLDELRAEIDRIVVATKNFLRPLDRRKYRFDALKH
jgi:CheY-like chemotaxis protein